MHIKHIILGGRSLGSQSFVYFFFDLEGFVFEEPGVSKFSLKNFWKSRVSVMRSSEFQSLRKALVKKGWIHIDVPKKYIKSQKIRWKRIGNKLETSWT